MLKCSKTDAKNVDSGLQNDSSTDIADESEITDKGNLDKSNIMISKAQINGADNDTGAPDATEIVDNGANYEIVHSANWDISISVVIDNSVPEKSFKSVIMDNVAQISQIS